MIRRSASRDGHWRSNIRRLISVRARSVCRPGAGTIQPRHTSRVGRHASLGPTTWHSRAHQYRPGKDGAACGSSTPDRHRRAAGDLRPLGGQLCRGHGSPHAVQPALSRWPCSCAFRPAEVATNLPGRAGTARQPDWLVIVGGRQRFPSAGGALPSEVLANGGVRPAAGSALNFRRSFRAFCGRPSPATPGHRREEGRAGVGKWAADHHACAAPLPSRHLVLKPTQLTPRKIRAPGPALPAKFFELVMLRIP